MHAEPNAKPRTIFTALRKFGVYFMVLTTHCVHSGIWWRPLFFSTGIHCQCCKPTFVKFISVLNSLIFNFFFSMFPFWSVMTYSCGLWLPTLFLHTVFTVAVTKKTLMKFLCYSLIVFQYFSTFYNLKEIFQ